MYTGYGKSAGTTAEVSFILSGDEGESEPRLLKDPKRKTFQRRGVDVFLATFPESFGELNYLHIWHNNAGEFNPLVFTLFYFLGTISHSLGTSILHGLRPFSENHFLPQIELSLHRSEFMPITAHFRWHKLIWG